MKFNFKRLTVLMALMMVCAVGLAGCGQKSNKGYSTTGGGGGNYQGVIKNGRYRTSKSRGVNVGQNDNQYNLKSFENGLTQVSKRVFSTKNYIFQEGQYLDTETVQNWLGRKTAKNPSGLNPARGSKSNPNPQYIQQLEEQDYMTESGNKLRLRGMTIGIGVNSEWNYSKKTGGANYTKDISNSTVTSEGEAAAQKVLTRMRAKKGVGNVPIVLAIYKQAPDDSLVGGSFVEYAKCNGNKVGTWHKLNYKTAVLPKSSGSNTTNKATQSDNDSFSNFKSQVQSFFPNLSGVTAQAQYNNGQLDGMHITITTQFYSQTEINSFTQYIARAARSYLPSGIPIDIKIQSDSEMQAVVFRDSGQKNFTTHIFQSY